MNSPCHIAAVILLALAIHPAAHGIGAAGANGLMGDKVETRAAGANGLVGENITNGGDNDNIKKNGAAVSDNDNIKKNGTAGGDKPGYKGVGAFNSFKGFGVRFDFEERDSEQFSSVILFADVVGVAAGNDAAPGVRLQYSRNRVLKTYEPGNSICRFYVGPGAGCGWVTDAKTSRYGLFVSANCTVGWRWEFPAKHLLLDLSLTGDVGMHVRREDDNLKLALYKRGIYCCPLPQLSFIYRF